MVFGFLFCVGAFGVQILAMGAILQTATGISLTGHTHTDSMGGGTSGPQ